MSFPELRKIETEEMRLAVIEAARADNDVMDFPTHVYLKNGEIAGAICMGGVPLVMTWSHTQKNKARDSMFLSSVISSVMNDRNSRGYFIACNDRSPYMGHMEKLGFEPVWPTNLFYKR